MMCNQDRFRDWRLFLTLALAGVVAALNHVHIPHTEVLIDGRWAFGFIGFALLRQGWAALALAALLSYPYGAPEIPLWIGFAGNMLYAVPSLLTIRPLAGFMLRRWREGWLYGLGWMVLVLVCYQAFITPVVWGVLALLENRPVTVGVVEGWRTQPFLVESILVALFSAAAMVAVLAVRGLRTQRRRVEHINGVLQAIRNVNQLIVAEDDPCRLIEKACINLTETLGYFSAWIALQGGEAGQGLGLPEKGPVAIAAAAGFDGGFERLREDLERGDFPDCMNRALEAGGALVVDDPAAECADCPLKDEYHGRAGLVRRLDYGGVTYGILTASVPAAYAQDIEEQDLFNEVAGDLAFALHKIETKTARESALAALSRNHMMMARTEAIAHVGSWEWDITEDSVHWSDELFRIFERDRNTGAPSFAQHSEIYWPEDMERLSEAVERCVSQGTPYELELKALRSNGGIRHCVARGQAETDETGRVVRLVGSLQDITERKRAEAQLRAEKEWSGKLINYAPNVIVGLEEGAQIAVFNRFAEKLTGYNAEEVIGKDWIKTFIPEDLRGAIYQVWDNIVENQSVNHHFENEIVTKSGERRLIEWRNTIVTENGEFRMILSLGVDITERKQQEEALRRGEERFRRAIGEAPFPAMIHAEDGEVVMINAEWTRLTGYQQDEIPTIEGWTEKAYGRRQGAVRKVIDELYDVVGHMDEGDFEIRCRDGSMRIWTFRSTPLGADETGRRLVMSMAVDITDRVRAQEKRERLAAQVSAQARQMQAILKTVPQAVLLLDGEGRILHANPVAERDLAVLTGEREGAALTYLGDRPLVELLTSPPVKGLWHEVKADGRTFEVIARPVEQGLALEQWVLVINDVSRELEVKAQLRRQEQLAAVGQLAGGIAHDFNNIMAVIILYAEMIARSEGSTDRDREKAAVINQQGKHASRLIQQILDFSRQAVLEQRPLDLLPLLKEQVRLLERTLPEHIEIALAHSEEEYVISADLTRMQQMIMNLALNARDAMPRGGSLRIGLEEIKVQPGESPLLPEMAAGDWVRLTVVDTGTGIAPDVLPHIFDPFFTTKGPGEGSGLGLAQVEGIVGQHGGRIGVTTEVGKGTTFTIYLPLLKARPVEPPTTDVSALSRGRGEVVLVVEDGDTVRAALVKSLEQMDYETLEAANGEQALALMEKHGEQIALVLSDVVMPVMGGVRLLHGLREQGWEMPVILLSGHVMGEDLDELRAQGLSAWMSKPPDLEQLAQTIASALDK